MAGHPSRYAAVSPKIALDTLSVAGGRDERTEQAKRRGKIGVSLAAAVCAISWNASAREHSGQDWYRVNVQMSSQVTAPPDLLRDGQAAASNIFAGIHVQLIWTGQTQQGSRPVAGCASGLETHDLAVEVIPHAPARFSDAALAMAMPYAEFGVRIAIFYDRVWPLLRGHHAPQASVLGYVLAHEITHVFQGLARHSATGIMRARWTDNDFKQMGVRTLTFTAEDVQLIRQHLGPTPRPTGCSDLLSANL